MIGARSGHRQHLQGQPLEDEDEAVVAGEGVSECRAARRLGGPGAGLSSQH